MMRDEIFNAIREDWHDAGMYGRADFHPRWLDGLADVTAQVAALAVADHVAAITARAEAAEAKVARVEALAEEWEGWAAVRSTTRIDAFRDAADHLRAALAPAPTEGANVRQIGSDERVGTKEDA